MGAYFHTTAKGRMISIVPALLLLYALLDYLDFAFISIALSQLLPQLLFEVKSRRIVLVWQVVSIPVALLGLSGFLPAVLWLLMMRDQGLLIGRLGTPLNSGLQDFETLLHNCLPPLFEPVFGCNDQWSFGGIMDEIRDNGRNFVDAFFSGYAAELEYLRPPGVSRSPLSVEGIPDDIPKNITKVYSDLVEISRRAVFLLLGTLLFLILGPIGLLIVGSAYAVSLLEGDSFSTGTEKNAFKDGIYRVRNTYFGFELSRGVAVSHQGVLHVPYHVTAGARVSLGRQSIGPFYSSKEKDLITYGGPPSISKYQEGQRVFANCETDTARVSYEVQLRKDEEGTLTWLGQTVPGDSGSPLYALDDNGDIHLLGLCGRYYRPPSSDNIEFANEVPSTAPSRIHPVVTHPGSGKTRNVIPSLVDKHLAHLGNGKILITGPTRVVCKELYEALKTTHSVGLNILATPGRNPSAKIQIAAHASALKMLASKDSVLAGVSVVIIDEAHFDDAATITLRRLCRGMNYETYELSATLDGKCAVGSNYAISEKQISSNDIIPVVQRQLEAGKRVLVFVPGVKSKITTDLLRRFEDYNAVLLSRATYASASASIRETSEEGYINRLIISTDIAECGINIPELDVVVDTSSKLFHVQQGKFVQAFLAPPNKASVIQRRGRVGRTKTGHYFYVHEPVDSDLKTSAELDSDILCSGRSWSPSTTNDWGISLSDRQYFRCLSNGEVPFWTYLSSNSLGNDLRPTDLRRNIMDLRSGTLKYEGCGHRKCHCAGFYTFYDERIHDQILGVGDDPSTLL